MGVHFQYASFEAILQHAVSKLSGFVNLQYLTFDSTALVTFQQLQALLVKLRKLPKFVPFHDMLVGRQDYYLTFLLCCGSFDCSHGGADRDGFGVHSRLRGISAINNPVTMLKLYRPFMLHLFPVLTVLDGVTVTQKERHLSRTLFGQVVSSSQHRRNSISSIVVDLFSECLSFCVW